MIFLAGFHFVSIQIFPSTIEINNKYTDPNIVRLQNSDPPRVRDWNQTWGGINDDFASGVAVDGNNNIYLSGYTYFDALLVRYDPAGNQIWNRTWGGPNFDSASGVAVDGSNNIYLSGSTQSFGSGDQNAFLVKYDPAGNQIWNRTWSSTDFSSASGVAVDGNNNIYLSGSTLGDAFLVKYDPAGNQIWNGTWGGSNHDYGYGVAVDGNNNIYLSGSTVSFGAGGEDAFLVKYGIDSDNDGLSDYNEINVYGTDPNNPDTDGDFMPDGWEVNNLLDPLNSTDASLDSDLDGLSNLDEYYNGTDPNDSDTDDDLMPDGWEVNNSLDPLNSTDVSLDNDLDGLSSLDEYNIGTDPNDQDTDDDFMPDGWEINNLLDPLNSLDASLDSDLDGLSNLDEYNNDADPNDSDTDDDLMPDGWEVDNSLDPLADDSSDDADGDALNNLLEYQLNTNPNDGDTDDDGLNDYAEFYVYETDPTNPDTDGDGYSDGEEISAGSDPLDPNSVPLNDITFFEKYGFLIGFIVISVAIVATTLIRRHSIQAKKFRIFISHAVKDVENYRIVELAEYLESRKEISHVYYCEEDLIGNIDDWMRKTVPRCQLLIFFSTENSLKSKDCDNEIKIARKHGIQISPVLGVNLKWEDLEELNIDRELGERFDPMEFMSFCEKIYNYVLKYKEDIEKDSLEKKKDKKRKKL